MWWREQLVVPLSLLNDSREEKPPFVEQRNSMALDDLFLLLPPRVVRGFPTYECWPSKNAGAWQKHNFSSFHPHHPLLLKHNKHKLLLSKSATVQCEFSCKLLRIRKTCLWNVPSTATMSLSPQSGFQKFPAILQQNKARKLR